MLDDRNYIFISYISRSGSTYLCSLLDELEDTCVSIEAGFPGAPFSILPQTPLISENELNNYLSKLYADTRFQDWNISKETLKSHLMTLDKQITFKDILVQSLNLYFNNPKPFSNIIYKAGYFIDHLPTIRKMFPNSKHIYIMRDPKGILSSQKHSESLYSSKPMASNFYGLISQYKKRTLIALQNKNENDFLIIRYEGLVSNPENTIKQCADFIGLKSNKKKNDGERYSKKIPPKQKSLHTNIEIQNIGNLSAKWKASLKYRETKSINTLLKSELIAFNYDTKQNSPFKCHEYFMYLGHLIIYSLFRLKHCLLSFVFNKL